MQREHAARAKAERRSVSVSRTMAAPPDVVFAVLTDIHRHGEFDGSGMLRGSAEGPDRLVLGSEFSMAMTQGRRRYRSYSRVVEFEPERRIAWATTGRWRGHTYIGGQRWRYVLTPVANGTDVVLSYVWGYATLPLLTIWLLRFPTRMNTSMRDSLTRLDAVTSSEP